MAAPHLPPEVAGLIFEKLELVRDKLAFLAVCSSWRSSVIRGVQTLLLTSSEQAPPAAVASLLAAFHHQHRVTTSKIAPDATPAHDVPTGSSTLTRIALHTGSFTHISRDLLRAISHHTNLRSLAIGAEAELLVAPQDAPTADDYERLFSHCVRLQDVRFAGSLACCHGAQPVSVPIVNIGVRFFPISPFSWCGPLIRVRRKRRGEKQDVEVPLRKPNLPRSLSGLQSLTHLHVGPNVFGSHSLTIVAQLPSLTSLAIPVDLGFPPSALRSLTGLRSLDLQLDHLPAGLGGLLSPFLFPSSLCLLTRLKRLGIFGVVDAIRLDFQHAPANLESLTLDGWVGCHTHPTMTHPGQLKNLTHLTALSELDIGKCPGVVIRSSEISGLCLQVLDVHGSSLVLNDSVAEEGAEVGAIFPERLLKLRVHRLSFDKCSLLAFHLRSYLQSLEVLHITDKCLPSNAAPGATTLPPLPNLVELHISCRFSLLDEGEGVGLEEKFPALRQVEFRECGCYESFDVHAEENAAVISEALAHPCITHLTLTGFYFSTFPPQCSCPDVCEVHLLDQEVQKQRQQQSTECIRVSCGNLERLSLHGFKATTVTFCVPIPHLQSLQLVGCPRLCSVHPKDKALAALFPSLERIEVRDCGVLAGKEKQWQ